MLRIQGILIENIVTDFLLDTFYKFFVGFILCILGILPDPERAVCSNPRSSDNLIIATG